MYQNESALVKSKTQIFGFGSSKRADHLTMNKDMPGPGNYNVEKKNEGGY